MNLEIPDTNSGTRSNSTVEGQEARPAIEELGQEIQVSMKLYVGNLGYLVSTVNEAEPRTERSGCDGGRSRRY